MFLVLAIILAVAWICGFTLFHVTTAAIHILIALAVISLIVHLVHGRSARTT